MKLTTSLILITLLFISSNQAQEKQDSTDYLKAGLWSLQFGIASNFTLSSFNGGTISIKYHLTGNSAIRTGVTLNSQIDKVEQDSRQNRDDLHSVQQISNTPRENTNISINANYLYYPELIGNFQYFIGTGIMGNWKKYKTDESSKSYQLDTLNSISSILRNEKTFEIGIQGIFGIEYFISESFSLHAEYSSTFSYSITKRIEKSETIIINQPDYNMTSNNEYDIKGWKFYPSGVRFGASVYF